MENKKLTKREKFAMVMEYVTDNEMLTEFLQNEINLLTKKASSSTKSKTQVENEGIKDVILNALIEIGESITITDLQKTNEELGKLSNQKISALMTQLKNEGKVERIQDKKKSYFKANV